MAPGSCQASSALGKAVEMPTSRESTQGFDLKENKMNLIVLDVQGCQLPRLDISTRKRINKETSLLQKLHIYVNLLKTCSISLMMQY